ncbi:MAG: type II toxin-antitoxin system death-on-curing family toxin [Chloroflexota bacterium]
MFDGKELYPDLFLKAAALLESLVNKHSFVDGNKRTGVTAAALFLRANGWRLIAENAELEGFTLRVAASHPEIAVMADWLRRKCQKM